MPLLIPSSWQHHRTLLEHLTVHLLFVIGISELESFGILCCLWSLDPALTHVGPDLPSSILKTTRSPPLAWELKGNSPGDVRSVISQSTGQGCYYSGVGDSSNHGWAGHVSESRVRAQREALQLTAVHMFLLDSANVPSSAESSAP